MMASVQLEGRRIAVGTIFCIGRNYAAHNAELNHPTEPFPLVFLKPLGALLHDGGSIQLPAYSHDVQHECELVLLIAQPSNDIAEDQVLDYIAGVGVGLDLTARDIQTLAKQQGHPWTRAKGFRSSACVSSFIAPQRLAALDDLHFSLEVNGKIRQEGHSAMMLFKCSRLIALLARDYGLSAGDLIYTGTPEGVATLYSGDQIVARLEDQITARWDVR